MRHLSPSQFFRSGSSGSARSRAHAGLVDLVRRPGRIISAMAWPHCTHPIHALQCHIVLCTCATIRPNFAPIVCPCQTTFINQSQFVQKTSGRLRVASVSEVANNFEGLVGIIAMRWDFFLCHSPDWRDFPDHSKCASSE